MDRKGDAYIAAHPARFRILQTLAKGALSGEKLAKRLDMSPNLAYFHLLTLQQHGLVKSGDYVLGNPPEDPRAVVAFELTDEGRELGGRLEPVFA